MLAENYLQRFGRPIEVELPGGNFTAASGTVPLGHILHTTKITSTDNITRNHAVLNLWFPTFLDFLDPIFTPQISCEPRDIVSLTETLFVFHYHVYSWASWSLQGWKTIQTKITKCWWKEWSLRKQGKSGAQGRCWWSSQPRKAWCTEVSLQVYVRRGISRDDNQTFCPGQHEGTGDHRLSSRVKRCHPRCPPDSQTGMDISMD